MDHLAKDTSGRHDYVHLLRTEMSRLADFLDSIDDGVWTAPSLCSDWRVCDVAAHVTYGPATPWRSTSARLVTHGMRPHATLRSHGIALAEQRSRADHVKQLRSVAANFPTGLNESFLRFIGAHVLAVDHIIHHLDATVLLGRPYEPSEPALVAALDAAPGIGGLMRCKQRSRGLRLEAADVQWTFGDGPAVTGPGTAILLALSGRPAGLSELHGPGVDVLRRRVSHRGRTPTLQGGS